MPRTRPTMKRAWLTLTFCIIATLGSRPIGAAKPHTYSPVPLTVTIHDVDSESFSCGICSDSAGDYIDGVDGVAASFDQYGNIIINFQTTRSKMRGLHYNYLPLGSGQPTPPSDPPNNYFSTVKQDGQDGTPLQLLANGATECVAGGPVFTVNDSNLTQYRVSFHRDYQAGIDVSLTSWLVVTRTSDTTWNVEPSVGACNAGNVRVAKIIQTPTKGRSAFTDDGLYLMPFRMTLTAN